MSDGSGVSGQSKDLENAGYVFGGLGALAAIAYGFGLLFWLAGQLSGVLTGSGWPDATLGDAAATAFRVWVNLGDPAQAWPAAVRVQIGPAVLVYLLLVVLLVPPGYLAFQAVRFALNWRRRRTFRRFRLGFASGNEIRRSLSARAVINKAKSVRPSFKGRRRFDPKEVGYYLGRDIRSMQKLYASVEDVFIILAPPRQGKDVHFCAPFTIDAPGACIVTSSRADAFTNTYAMRSKMGEIFVFDPNGLTAWPERLRWSPIRGCENPNTAAQRAAALVTGSGLEQKGDAAFWVGIAISILRCYLHAAAIANMTIRDVVRWTTQPTNTDPLTILRRAEAEGIAAPGWASELETRIAADPKVRALYWSTLVQALTCFSDPDVVDACSPAPDEVFDLKRFLSGRNTLYILGKEKKDASVSAVVTAMVEDLFDGARRIASRMPGSRMDPPLTVELNEAAHVCPLPSLPSYMGDSGGFSIALHVYLQSLSQARAKWGENEAMIMWDNAAVRVIMGGAGNVEDLEDVSRLMGDFDEKRETKTRGSGQRNVSVQETPRRVLSPEDIRTLEFGTAVVVARSARPVEVQLTPWWKRKDGKQIGAGKAATDRMILQYTEEAERRTKSLLAAGMTRTPDAEPPLEKGLGSGAEAVSEFDGPRRGPGNGGAAAPPPQPPRQVSEVRPFGRAITSTNPYEQRSRESAPPPDQF